MGSVQAQFGKLDDERLLEMSDNAIRGPGVCSGMATANSMHVVVEALGMACQAARPSRRTAEDVRIRAAFGQRIVQMVWDDLKPRDDPHGGRVPQCSRRGPRRQRLDQLHQASAGDGRRERRRRRRVRAVQRAREEIPVLSAVRPNGDDSIEAFEAAGGAPRS